jgi:hypothetical protein
VRPQETGGRSFLVLLPDVLIADAAPGAIAGLADACSQGAGWGVLLERLSAKESVLLRDRRAKGFPTRLSH